MDIRLVREEILEKSKLFFDSIENQFDYYEKYLRKYNLLDNLYAASIFILIICVLPLVALASKDSLIAQWNFSFYNINLSFDNFYIRWIISSILSAILFGILHLFSRHFTKKQKRHSISRKHLAFAHLFKAVKELNAYIINERQELLQNANDNINKYLDLSFLFYEIGTGNERTDIYLPESLNELQKRNSWIEFAKSTKDIMTAFAQYDEKIEARIEQNIEIDKVIHILSGLVAYEYLQINKVKKDPFVSFQETPNIIGNSILHEVANDITKLEVIDSNNKQALIASKKWFTMFTTVFANCFTHKNIFVTFISWTFLLSILFTAFLYLGVKAYNIRIDSTLFIGTISGIMIGALTMAGTIYSKKK